MNRSPKDKRNLGVSPESGSASHVKPIKRNQGGARKARTGKTIKLNDIQQSSERVKTPCNTNGVLPVVQPDLIDNMLHEAKQQSEIPQIPYEPEEHDQLNGHGPHCNEMNCELVRAFDKKWVKESNAFAKSREGVKCNRCQKRGHIAAKCTEKEHKFLKQMPDPVKKQLDNEAQRQLGEMDAKIEALKLENEKYKEKVESSKQTNEKNWIQIEKIFSKDKEIRAPTGEIVEGINIKEGQLPLFMQLITAHRRRMTFWMLATTAMSIISLLMILAFTIYLYKPQFFLDWEALSYFNQIMYMIHWLLTPHATFMGFVLRSSRHFIMWILTISEFEANMVTNALFWVIDLFHDYMTLFQIYLSVSFILTLFRWQYNCIVSLKKTEALLNSRDPSDHRKHYLTPVLRQLQAEKIIKLDWERDFHLLNNFFNYEFKQDLAQFYDLAYLFCYFFIRYPQFIFTVLPMFIIHFTKTCHIPVELLNDRDYYLDEYDVDKEPSLIKSYNIIRKIRLHTPCEPRVDYDARPDNLALSKMNYIDPQYAHATATYEMPCGVNIKMKNQYTAKISIELFMQLTTPHIINLLDDEASVKFRLNRSSVNFHGVNIDKYQHLLGEDVINTTLDVVFHYYRNRRWAYCQACPDELFYNAPKQ